MTKLKLYYAGWLALPAALRQKLDLGTDAVLEAELVDGTIVLRPVVKAKGLAALTTHHLLHDGDGSAIAPLPFGTERGDVAWWVG